MQEIALKTIGMLWLKLDSNLCGLCILYGGMKLGISRRVSRADDQEDFWIGFDAFEFK